MLPRIALLSTLILSLVLLPDYPGASGLAGTWTIDVDIAVFEIVLMPKGEATSSGMLGTLIL